MLGDIERFLEQFGVSFDRWYSERALRRKAARSIVRWNA